MCLHCLRYRCPKRQSVEVSNIPRCRIDLQVVPLFILHDEEDDRSEHHHPRAQY